MGDQNSSKTLSFFSKIANLADADVSEEDKIRVMINQSALNLNTKHGTAVSESYTCYRCGNTGHHIRNCPTSGDKNFEGPLKIKKSTGIPRSFMLEVDDPNIKGVMLTNSGRYAIPAIDAEAYAVGKKEKPPFVPQEKPKSEGEEEPIPDELVCLICHDLLGDAVVIPCCGNSYCDDCIRSALLDSEEHVCPTCGQSDVSPDTLIANKFLRQAVNNFKKERSGTGKVGKISVASTSKTSTPAPVPTAPPVSVQNQLNKPLQSPCSQKDSLLNCPNAAKPTSVTKDPDVPHETVNPASAENSSNTSPQLVDSQALKSNNEDEDEAGDDLAAVAPFLAVSDNDPRDAPKQPEPQVNSCEEVEQIQTVILNQRNSSSDSALGRSFSSNSWESTCSSASSAPAPGGSTDPSTEQHRTPSSSFSSYSATPSPFFSSPPLHTFVSTHQPPSGYPPGYPQTTPTWKLPAPQGAPIPSLCASTCASTIPFLNPKEWPRCEREKRDRSPHRHSTSYSKFSKSSRSYSRSSSRSASRSRSRSRPRSPSASHRNFQPRSNPSSSYGYKRPTSHTSSSLPWGAHSRSKSHHRKSRHHSKRSSSSSHSSKRLGEAGQSSNTADVSSQELERQRYLEWKEEYKEWYDKFYSTFIIHFQKLPLPPLPPPPCSQDSFCPSQTRCTASPPSSETSSYSRSPPSQSSSDTHSTASHPSVDSCSSDKANDRYSSPSQSSSDSRSTPSEDRAQPRELPEHSAERFRPGTVTKSSVEANSQGIKIDTSRQILKEVDESSHSNHEQKKKKTEGRRAEASDSLDSKSDLRQDRRSCNTEPHAVEEGHPGPRKASESVQLPLKKDKPSDKHGDRKDKEESHLKKKQSSRISQDSQSRQDMEKKDKVNPSKGPNRVPTEREQPGSSRAPDSRSEVTRKRKREDLSKTEKKSGPVVRPQSSKGPKTKPAEPQSHDRKHLKLSDKKKQKPENEESKALPLTPMDIWEGGIKVIPQKKISININLDGLRKDERTNSPHVEVQTQETEDPTGGTEEKLNKDRTETEAGEKKQSSPENITKDKSVLPLTKEISDKVTFRDDKREEMDKKAEEKREDEKKGREEDSDLWHCALTCVEDSDENLTGTEAERVKDYRDKMFHASKTEESARRETRGEPRREEDVPAGSSSQRSKTKNLPDRWTGTSKTDSSGTSARSSCGVQSHQKKTVIKTQAESSQSRAEVSLPVQVSHSRRENDGEKPTQTEILDSEAGPQPSVTVTNCETDKNNDQQRQRSTEQRQERDRAAARGREKEKERHSNLSHSDVAPPGGGDWMDVSAWPKRDKETKTERPKERERTRESENQKERERLKHGTREEASMQKRNEPSSSSAWYDKERRDRQRGSEQGSSIMSRKTFKEGRNQYLPDHRSPDLMSKMNIYHFQHYNYQQFSSGSYRERNRPDWTQHSPPSPCSEDKHLLLFESAENFQKGCPGRGFVQNKARNESRAQKGEEKSEKTTLKECKGGRETPEAGDCRGRGGGGSRREEKARKLEERRRSSSDSVRSSSSHRDDKREAQ